MILADGYKEHTNVWSRHATQRQGRATCLVFSFPSPSIENESIAEQDDDDLTKVATGTSHTHTQAQKRERRKTDHPKLENIICQSGLNDSTVKLIAARLRLLTLVSSSAEKKVHIA